MTEQSPYTSPETTQAPPTIPVPHRSAAPKVFGILHIIYASIGIIAGLFGLVNAKTDISGLPLTASQLAEANEAIDKTLPYTYISAFITIALGIFLIIAGRNLLKYKLAGLKQTNLWAIIRIVLAIVFTILSSSAQLEAQEKMLVGTPEALSILKAAAPIGIAFGILMISIYPIVSLIILNRKSAKKDLV